MKTLCVLALVLMLTPAFVLAQNSDTYFRFLGSNSSNGVYVAVGENVYYIDGGQSSWQPVPTSDLPPVPVPSLVFYSYWVAITNTGEGWLHTHNFSVWENIGTVPPDVVRTQKSSLGGVKTLYR